MNRKSSPQSDASGEPAALRAVVYGRVQGVGYRFFVYGRARSLGLGGWVRNRYDGCVELYACGARTALETLAGALYQGPALSRVEGVKFNWEAAPEPPARDFQIERTV